MDSRACENRFVLDSRSKSLKWSMRPSILFLPSQRFKGTGWHGSTTGTNLNHALWILWSGATPTNLDWYAALPTNPKFLARDIRDAVNWWIWWSAQRTIIWLNLTILADSCRSNRHFDPWTRPKTACYQRTFVLDLLVGNPWRPAESLGHYKPEIPTVSSMPAAYKIIREMHIVQ